ncbi:macrophage mannose receptor 1-like [Mugil cephalus]|uniref:macrophage mannose receptor 1-like n=1 Tax=Mugil cephalus TaxID=48193 RepID=UPI001FB5A18A|nr:macrophage mannose receptor 1-like [Mugil cephalus]
MRGNLFLLILMGQCSFVLCRLYEYNFIDTETTREEAQKYCRDNYSDLASVFDQSDVERLKVRGNEFTDEAWIGLHSIAGKEERMWHWSLPGVEFNETKWLNGEPNDKGTGGRLENCVVMDAPDEWKDFPCAELQQFVCYDETQLPNKTFHFIDYKLTWLDAQSYCRENYTDLISGVAQLEEKELIHKRKPRSNIWIGLFRDNWRWSDGNNFSFRNWESFNDTSGTLTNKCATVKETGKWGSDTCDKRKKFFCYDDKVILIKENKTWEEALYYCRDNYNDLVSITNPHQQRWVQERAKKASTPFVWLGLRYSCFLDFWFWCSCEVVNYKNWASDESNDCDMSGAMDTGGEHQWVKKQDNEMFNFICSK